MKPYTSPKASFNATMMHRNLVLSTSATSASCTGVRNGFPSVGRVSFRLRTWNYKSSGELSLVLCFNTTPYRMLIQCALCDRRSGVIDGGVWHSVLDCGIGLEFQTFDIKSTSGTSFNSTASGFMSLAG